MKGQKINDRYQIIKSIGEGGMANVYLAYDTILDRNVAVKVLRGDLATDEKFVRRFQREALSASSLSHPNIVEVYDVGEDNGQYYIVMEYIEGCQLKQLLKKRGRLTLSEVIDIMLQITDGLSVAHVSSFVPGSGSSSRFTPNSSNSFSCLHELSLPVLSMSKSRTMCLKRNVSR